jgi:glycosyltransferase involved in cell wall biosynthesis
VLPVYNHAATIGRAIASILSQTFEEWELVIVDDASDDDLSLSLADVRDDRIRLLHHERNRGAAAARNTGIKVARAPLVAFIDSDDEWLPTKLERQVAVMEHAGPSLGGLCTAFRLARTRTGYAEDRYPRAKGTWAEALLDGCFVSPGSTLMARRECFETVGMLDDSLKRFEDWDWLLRLVERYEFDCLPEVLAMVHVGRAPQQGIVESATYSFESRQAARIHAMSGPEGLRRFRASLALERANAAIAARRHSTAAVAILQASMLSPKRTFVFLTRGLARLKAGDI